MHNYMMVAIRAEPNVGTAYTYANLATSLTGDDDLSDAHGSRAPLQDRGVIAMKQ